MPLHTERRERVAVLTIEDADRKNALSPEMIAELLVTLEDLERNESVGALVLTGAGTVFCSGADLGNLTRLTAEAGGDPTDVREIYRGFLAFRETPLPTVAAVNGPAVGAGMNLALACDVRLTTPDAWFDTRFAAIGLHPGGGHVWMLDRLVGPQTTAAMTMFGESVDGERAVALGLAWRCVPDDELLEAAVTLAGKAAAVPRDLMDRVHATVREAPWHTDFDAAIAVELERQAWSFGRGYFNERLRRR
ncbi:MAG: enoyl-CoA hydratase [Actinobacteria bacterium]|nr:enoyl-CoA hydratase [Actinomycetota bacterium]